MHNAPDGRKDRGQAIDLDAGLERVMGDRAMYLRVLARFQADYRDSAQRLRAALLQDDPKLVQRIIHTLKGAAAMIEARRLRRLSHDIELALRAQAGADAAMVDALEAELARVLEALDAALAGAVLPASAMPAVTGDLATLRAMLDLGNGDAPALFATQRPALLATLGTERLRALDSAIGEFDFERALAVMDGTTPA
ncbi:Hpt domain-containing protein [Massilia niastensis]|uniref:Hpt domain-containing protein n=1 Tax=Massilia niastensis TaxID=544911 RepID=UPI00035C5D3B|nr:Hpt domain-containing protein [Massilia niastensis]